MEVKKMSLANIRGKLSREEMSKILAGDEGSICDMNRSPCTYYESGTGQVTGECVMNSKDQCVCQSANSSVVWQGCVVT